MLLMLVVFCLWPLSYQQKALLEIFQHNEAKDKRDNFLQNLF